MTQEEKSAAEKALLQAHRNRTTALLAGDAATLASLLDDRLLFVHANGRAESRAELIAAIAEGRLKYNALVFEDSRVLAAQGVGIVQGEMKAEVFSRGEVRALHTRFSSTWAEDDGGWKLLAYSATPA